MAQPLGDGVFSLPILGPYESPPSRGEAEPMPLAWHENDSQDTHLTLIGFAAEGPEPRVTWQSEQSHSLLGAIAEHYNSTNATPCRGSSSNNDG